MSRTPEWWEAARAMRAAGARIHEISAALGKAYTTVQDALNPRRSRHQSRKPKTPKKDVPWPAGKIPYAGKGSDREPAGKRCTTKVNGYGRLKAGIQHPKCEDLATDAEIRQLLSAVPPDTRDLTGRHFGDPLPGRSALDMRAQG